MSAKIAGTHLIRTFLLEGLPEPLTPASAHVQHFDGYIPNTRLRIRSVRDPSTKAWTRTLEQIYLSEGGEKPVIRSSGIHLSEDEYEVLAHLEGGEIRKNRYFHEFDRCEFLFDVYLGKLWGVCTAKVEFASEEERDEFRPPPFAKIEVTGNPFFMGANLVTKNFEDVQEELRAKLDV